jgi:ribonuclease HII
MEVFYEKNKLEVGLDEAGRGCLFGPVFTAGVIWNETFHDDIKDSKRLTLKKRNKMQIYIKENSVCYSVTKIDNDIIDNKNILNATLDGWRQCLDEITEKKNIDLILVDGPNFNGYINKNLDIISHICINGGDNKYIPIAAASILAKTYRDDYINKLVDENPELNKYDIKNNKGYGTKKHLEAIKEYGITKWHRKSFGICKNYNV